MCGIYIYNGSYLRFYINKVNNVIMVIRKVKIILKNLVNFINVRWF